MSVKIIKNLISSEECLSYIEFLDSNSFFNDKAGIYNALGYPSSLEASKVSEKTGAIIGDMSPLSVSLGALFTEIKTKAEQLFGHELDLGNATYQSCPEGFSNPMHADIVNLDGTPIGDAGIWGEWSLWDEVEWSGLLYLNTKGVDFEGGSLFFEEFDLDYSPEAGDLVLFNGDLEHRHEVREILGGVRKNLVFFWAKKGNVSDGSGPSWTK
jgi:hypothetical protein